MRLRYLRLIVVASALALALPASSAEDKLAVSSCQRNPTSLEDENCAMAKRVVSRRDRRAAGLCSDKLTDSAKASLLKALRSSAADDVFARAWPWAAPANLEVCGYANAPAAIDLEVTLQRGEDWLKVSGYTNDGTLWKFHEFRFTTPAFDVDASIPSTARTKVTAEMKRVFPWLTELSPPNRIDLIGRGNVLSFRDFEGAPTGGDYLARTWVSGASCGKAAAFFSPAAKLVKLVEEEKPHPCRPGIP